jgi:hypothetical protein
MQSAGEKHVTFRTINVLRIIAAFALAHLGAVFFVFGFLAFDSLVMPKGREVYNAYQLIAFLSVPATVVVGIPSFFVCRFFNKTGIVACVLGGSVAGVLSTMAFFGHKEILLFALPIVVPAGAFSGALFWLIGVYRNPLAKRSLVGTEALGEEKAGFPLSRE